MNRGWLRHYDWPLLIATLVLVGISLIVLQSINYKDPALVQEFDPNKQILFAGIGFGLMAVMARIDFRVWYRYAQVWYGIGLIALLLVFVIGSSALGATRWIDLGPLQFQPSEFIKLGLIFTLARLFSLRHEEMRNWRYLLLSLAYVAMPAVLIALQPDLGSAIVTASIWAVMILLSNAKRTHIAAIVAIGLVALPVLLSQLQPYQLQRIESFANPQADPQGAGYNVLQSTIAVGSGGLFGKGLSSGSQSQLNFLPAQQTDFIFAVLAEKLGFIGALLVLMLFAVIVARAILITWRAQDRFGMLLAAGITAMLTFHITINVGMNLGLLPVTGIPLPLLSYGGTNLIVSLAAIGLLQSIATHKKEVQFSS